jgi:hypothetical protein
MSVMGLDPFVQVRPLWRSTDQGRRSGRRSTVKRPSAGPVAFPGMKFGLAAAIQRPPGEIDYRLERQRILAAYRSGAQSTLQVCDAQDELARNAEHCGTASPEPCPICDAATLVHVTYVFGARLPSSGRCMTSVGEMQRLARRRTTYTAYVVEVCTECRWNHLVRSFLLNPLA